MSAFGADTPTDTPTGARAAERKLTARAYAARIRDEVAEMQARWAADGDEDNCVVYDVDSGRLVGFARLRKTGEQNGH